MSILQEIADFKRVEVQERKELYPTKLLERSKYFSSPCLSLAEYIKRPDKSGIIAEFKRKSPSETNINLYGNVEEITISYMQAGASGLSILTDEKYFGGSLKDLETARAFNYCPILRKDFIIDPYQIVEARSYGADAILLIAEILSESEIKSLSQFAKNLDLEVLIETHSAEQLQKIDFENIDLLGINNRDLSDFSISLETSISIAKSHNKNIPLISESGIKTTDDIDELLKVGIDGFLIGTRFMKSGSPYESCKSFSNHILNQLEPCL